MKRVNFFILDEMQLKLKRLTILKSAEPVTLIRREKHWREISVDHKKMFGADICSKRGIYIEKCPTHALKPEDECKIVVDIVEVVL